MKLSALLPRPSSRLAVGLAVLVCCSSTPPPPGGLLSSPAGAALAGTLLFIANQDANELHVFDTETSSFRPAPNWMFPLSIPTVRRPGPVCGNGLQMFTASSIDPIGAFIDANDNGFDDGGGIDPVNPPTGLRELGEMALPGVASDAVCSTEPGAMLAHKIAVAGSPAGYQEAISSMVLDAILLLPDGGFEIGVLPDGGLDERHTLANLPIAALMPFNAVGSATQVWEATNDITGVSCGAAAPAFCPTLTPLFSLPPQPAYCDPIGPPSAQRVDVSGANAGIQNLGIPNVEPQTANRLMASDTNSSCVASIDLDDMTVDWIPVGGPTTGVFASPHIPGAGLPGGDLFAVVADAEACELQGPPPVGGYVSCNGVSFVSADAGALLMEPLAYPFVPRHAEPPLRIDEPVTQVAFVGPSLQIGAFSSTLTQTVQIEELAMVGTQGGSMFYVDIGYGQADGGTGANDAGIFPFPPAYLAPRLFDMNDYIPDPVAPQVLAPVALDLDGGDSIGDVTQSLTVDAVTVSGGVIPTNDRQDGGFVTGLDATGASLPTVICDLTPQGAELCYTAGLVQKGVANDEVFTVSYEGTIGALGGIPANLSANDPNLLVMGYAPFAGNYPTIYNGLLLNESQNLTVDLALPDGGFCGEYSIQDGGVTVAGIALTPDAGPTCPVGPSLQVNIFASGAKPYTVSGTTTGFVTQLWPADGTMHLVPSARWHYPSNLIAMELAAQQLVDLVYGATPTPAVPNSALTAPTAVDYAALDSPFGLSVSGILGPFADGGPTGQDAGVQPERGAYWTFVVTSSVAPLVIDPQDTASFVETLTAYTDTVDGGTPFVIGTYRGGSALVELNPELATNTAIFEVH